MTQRSVKSPNVICYILLNLELNKLICSVRTKKFFLKSKSFPSLQLHEQDATIKKIWTRQLKAHVRLITNHTTVQEYMYYKTTYMSSIYHKANANSPGSVPAFQRDGNNWPLWRTVAGPNFISVVCMKRFECSVARQELFCFTAFFTLFFFLFRRLVFSHVHDYKIMLIRSLVVKS